MTVKVAVLDRGGRLVGVEDADEAAGRVEVHPGIDLPLDGSYMWVEDARAFVHAPRLPLDVVQLRGPGGAARAGRITRQAEPGAGSDPAPVDPDYAMFLALKALLDRERGRPAPLPDEVRVYVEWFDRVMRPRMERRGVLRLKRGGRPPVGGDL